MSLPQHLALLSEPVALWIATTDDTATPIIVRATGVTVSDNEQELTVFMPEVYSHEFFANLNEHKIITLLSTSVPTYESYQYKGPYKSIRPCTDAEVNAQVAYIDAFTDVVADIGYSKQGFIDSYLHQPSFALTFLIADVFDQTPYKGTGISVAKAE